MHTCVHACMHATHMCTCMHTTHTCTRTHTDTHTLARAHTCTRAHAHTFAHTCTRIHAHAHTHTRPRLSGAWPAQQGGGPAPLWREAVSLAAPSWCRPALRGFLASRLGSPSPACPLTRASSRASSWPGSHAASGGSLAIVVTAVQPSPRRRSAAETRA